MNTHRFLWEQYKEDAQNTDNNEFSTIRDYSFYLKRKTRNYHEPQKLLRLNTTGGANGEPTIETGSYTETHFTISTTPFVLNNASPEKYYESTVTFTKDDYSSFLPGNNGDKVQVKVKVYAVSRKVVFEGFAVYAQDGIPYTYIVDEDESTVFKPLKQNVSKEIVPTKDGNGNVTGGTVTLEAEYNWQASEWMIRTEEEPVYTWHPEGSWYADTDGYEEVLCRFEAQHRHKAATLAQTNVYHGRSRHAAIDSYRNTGGK